MENNVNEENQTFFEHLLELKNRLVKSLLMILVMFLVLFPFANEIYTFIAKPILDTLPENGSLISIGVISPFLTPLKMALIFSLYISMPFIIYQVWMFIAPGLYRSEKKLMIPLIISTGFLFYSGVMFSFYIVFPVIFDFLSTVGPSVVNFSPDIQYYLDFVLKVSFAFGIAFEVPIATIILIKFNIVSIATLRKNRAYVVIGAFLVGMILTPPDVISQTMIAIPMWLLFELGLIVAPYLVTINDPKDGGDDDHTPTDDKPNQKKDSNTNESEEDWDDDDFDEEFDKIDKEFDKLDEDEVDSWDGKIK